MTSKELLDGLKPVEIIGTRYCDLCIHLKGEQVEAQYDDKTIYGSWGYLCTAHALASGIGIGFRLVQIPDARPTDPKWIARVDGECPHDNAYNERHELKYDAEMKAYYCRRCDLFLS